MYTSKSIRGTIIIGVCWLAVITLFLAFNPVGFSFWQSTAVVLSSGVVAVGAVALTWVNWQIGD